MLTHLQLNKQVMSQTLLKSPDLFNNLVKTLKNY